jgi:hypothetical protein
MVLAGCEVTNPGPVQDEFLALPASQQGLVNGAIRALAELNGFGNYTAKLFGREFIPSGQTGSHGFDVIEHGGHAQEGAHGTEWTDFTTARFITETAIKRFQEVDAPDNMLYQAYLWNAVTYRTGAMFFCDGVDTPLPVPGELDPTTPGSFVVGNGLYLQRAVDAATRALTYANSTDETDKALLMRAQAYVHQGNWAAAVTDAAAVSSAGVIVQEHSGLEESLHLYGINGNNRKPWGSWSVDFTFFQDYYLETGDPRAEWFRDTVDPANEFAVASLSGFGPVPWSNSAVYGRYPDFQSQASPLGVIGNSHVTVDGESEVLGDYEEMQLIRAEERLVNNDIPGAIAFINSVRTSNQSHLDLDNDGNRFPTVDTGDNLPAYDPTGMTAPVAWALLMRERNVEMWMEGRRMADELRWIENGRAAASANLNAGGSSAGRSGEAYRPDCAAGTGGMYAIGCDGELGYMDVPNWEDPDHPAHTPLFTQFPRSRCFDITSTERERNPNVPNSASSGDRYFDGQSTWPPSWWP